MEVAAATAACVKLGHDILQRYKAYKYSDDRLTVLILRTERSWLKTSAQLELLDKIRNEFDSRLLETFDASLARLATTLTLARIEIETLTSHENSELSLDKISLTLTRSKRLRYSIFEKHVKKTVEELMEWQNEFDPTWLFTILLTSKEVDSALSRQLRHNPDAAILDDIKAIRAVLQDIKKGANNHSAVFKDDAFIATAAAAARHVLPYSNLIMAKASGSNQNVVLDATHYPLDADSDDVRRQVGDLALILMHGEPATMGLLKCLGVLQLLPSVDTGRQYQFVYSIPDSLARPATLRHMLSETNVSLDVKFSLVKTLARGVTSVHAADFVHKNIRPETILVFRESESNKPVAFLVGFERFRGVQDGTAYTGDMVWYRNLYRHPQRQGKSPDFMYQMQHDIYSLGVCLLEIGLWESFVVQADPPQCGSSLDIMNELDMTNKRQAALSIKKKLVHLASAKLPALMGLVYTEVVISCLTCLDPDATNTFANEKDLRQDDSILVGMMFIDKIFTRLLSIQFCER